MSRKIAYAGMLLAVDTVLFLMVNIFQTNTIFLLGLASLPIAIVIMNWGNSRPRSAGQYPFPYIVNVLSVSSSILNAF